MISKALLLTTVHILFTASHHSRHRCDLYETTSQHKLQPIPNCEIIRELVAPSLPFPRPPPLPSLRPPRLGLVMVIDKENREHLHHLPTNHAAILTRSHLVQQRNRTISGSEESCCCSPRLAAPNPLLIWSGREVRVLHRVAGRVFALLPRKECDPSRHQAREPPRGLQGRSQDRRFRGEAELSPNVCCIIHRTFVEG